MLNYIKIIFFVLLVFCLGSCRMLQPNNMFRVPKDFAYSEFKNFEKEYRIQPYDRIRIQVSTNDGENLINYKGGAGGQSTQGGTEYIVEFDGTVKLPTLGRIQIEGKSTREAEAFLEAEFSKFLNNPFVILEVSNRKIFVFGDGGANGQIITIDHDNFTIIEAIAIIGGLSFDSKSYKIKLIRGDLNKNPEIYVYNIYNLADLQNSNLLLQANDILYIESKPKYVSKVLMEISPYLTLTTTMLFIYSLFIK